MYRIFSSVFVILLFSYCARKPISQTNSSTPNSTISKPNKIQTSKSLNNLFEDVTVQARERILASQAQPSFVVANKTINRSDRLVSIYALNNNQPFWLYPNRVEEALQVLKESASDGLNPQDYEYLSLLTYYTKLKNDMNAQQAYELEVLLTYNLLKYSKHMLEGKVNPVSVFPEWNYPKRSEKSISDTILARIFTGKLESFTTKIRPDHAVYTGLRETLSEIDAMQASNFNLHTIRYTGKSLKVGDTASVLIEVKKHLRAVGLYNHDSLDNQFDKTLIQSLKDFQVHVGLKETGTLDKKTLNVLNFTLPELRNAVLANMERSRWTFHDLPEEYIWVNIADYTLTHIKNNKQLYKEDVIVGKDVNKTPVFQASLSYIEFNPYWTVPASIAGKEILLELLKDPTYLEKHDMELFLNNEPVPAPASFESYSETNFPFTIKQNPGKKNSLGRVKFMFPNPYSIYIHDTPTQYLFEKEQRSFSHGCIRLKNPIDFAYHLLSPQGFTINQITEKVYSEKNESISLERKIPIMIVYFTCYSKPNDKHLFFFKDIYGHDQKIVQLLNQSNGAN